MGRTLCFELDGQQHQAGIEKVDRKKVYGWVDKKAVDADGSSCYFGALSSDGVHIFGPGCFEMGHLDDEGHWIERSELNMVDEGGAPLEKVPSSFKAPIGLETVVSPEEYLMYTAKALYELAAPAELLARVKQIDGLFQFPYNYSDSWSPDTAFLVENEDRLFLVVGEPTGFDFIGPDQIEVPLPLSDEEEEEEEIDFGMF